MSGEHEARQAMIGRTVENVVYSMGGGGDERMVLVFAPTEKEDGFKVELVAERPHNVRPEAPHLAHRIVP